MSRNVWHYGAPLLDHDGPAHWSTTWSPVFPFLVSPLGALPMGAAVLAERIAVMLVAAAFLVLVFWWLRRELHLEPLRAGLATLCVASTYGLVRNAALVMSDLPAAAAMMGGLVALRRGRLRSGIGLLFLAALIRPVYAAVVVAALVWLLVSHGQNRRVARAALAGLGALALGAGTAAAAGYRGYLWQVVHPASGGVLDTVVRQAKALSWYPLGWIAYTPSWLVDHARALVKIVSLALLAVAAFGARRRALPLEALVVVAMTAALLLYRTTGAGDARYVIPLTPLVIGGIAVALDRRGRAWTAALALVAALAVSSGVYYYVDVTPSPSAFARDVAERGHAYAWVRGHVPRENEVVALDDVQAFLYSRHRVDRKVRRFAPGRTYVIAVPYAGPGDLADQEADLLRGYRRHEVFRAGSVAVYRLDARTRRRLLRSP